MVEGKQFDEALVERLAALLMAALYRPPRNDEGHDYQGFIISPGSAQCAIKSVLAALSETHVIVGKAEYFKTLGMVEKACLNCGTSFWSRHGNQRYCPACDRRTVWSRKRRAQAKEVSTRA